MGNHPSQSEAGNVATTRPRQIKRVVAAVVVVFVLVPAVYVADQFLRTLRALSVIERERDTWQRPDEILRYLQLADGMTVVDLGSGAGYFALKIAPRVGPNGRVLAVDLRRQSLAFLWIRALARRSCEPPRHPRPGRRSEAAGRTHRRGVDCEHLSRADRARADPEGPLQRRCAPARGWSSSIAARATNLARRQPHITR